ncbi:MAG: hypothetical protein CMG55_10345 [Candidatus Marinimicrobia bacterium]|nr:hypothetical protein [Candidatus Neomarinimicrobiota bacterium]|tara:strand:+ start:149 stop:343 length:195 start_codon:yes stop_codon:yes gene_type:complete
MANSQNDINTNEIEMLKKRIAKLEEVVDDFMDKWGPGVQEKRKRRDEVWDEMVRVLTIQNKTKQ